jgi:hypothetical protein
MNQKPRHEENAECRHDGSDQFLLIHCSLARAFLELQTKLISNFQFGFFHLDCKAFHRRGEKAL